MHVYQFAKPCNEDEPTLHSQLFWCRLIKGRGCLLYCVQQLEVSVVQVICEIFMLTNPITN